MAFKNNTKIDQIKDYLKKSNDYSHKTDIIKFLKKNKDLPFNEDVLYDVLKIIIDNDLQFDISIAEAQKLYNIIVYQEDNLEQYKMFLSIFPIHQKCDNYASFRGISNFEILYNMFENKKLLESIYREITNMSYTYYVYNYIIEVREYFVDEIAFYASIMKFIRIVKSEKRFDYQIEPFKNEQIENAKKMAGLYEINEKELEELPKKIEYLKKEQKLLDEKILKTNQLIEQFLATIDKDMEKYDKEKQEELKQLIKDYVEEHLDELKKTNNEISDNSKIDTLIEQLMLYNNKSNNSASTNRTNLTNNVDKRNEIYINHILMNIKEDINSSALKKIGNGNIEIDEKIIDELKEIIDSRNALDLSEKMYEYYKLYYYALYNNTEDIFYDLHNLMSLEEIKYKYLESDIVSKFDKDLYIYLFPLRSYLIDKFYDSIDLLIEILNINKDYFYKLTVEEILKITKIFDIETLAQCDSIFGSNISYIYSSYDSQEIEKAFKTYKNIYDINPKFKFFLDFLYKDDIIYQIFTLEEIANLNEIQQQRLYDLIYDINVDLAIKYKEFIRNCVLKENLEVYIDTNVLQMFEKNVIKPEQYLLLNYDISSKIVRKYIDTKYSDIELIVETVKLKKYVKQGKKYIKNKDK